MSLHDLHIAIEAVCPIAGLRDTRPIEIQFLDVATEQQRTAAQAVVDAWDFSPQAEASRNAASIKSKAVSFFNSQQHESRVIRALMLLVMDELNNQASKINAVLTAIDNAGSLAALKTTIAAMADLPIRTAPQLKNATQNKIGTEDAD